METVIAIVVIALLQLQDGVAQNIVPIVSVNLEPLKEALKEVIHDEIASLRAELLEKDRIMQQLLCVNYTGKIGMCAGSSCGNILEEKPDSSSGYNWLKACETCEPFQAFCYFDHEDATAWMRVVDLDMTNHSQQCPSQFKLITSPRRLCGRKTDGFGCDSKVFETHAIQYRKVAGRTVGYEILSNDAFNRHAHCPNCKINQPYVDGISITHGFPRNHIWTYAAAQDMSYCPCVTGNPQLQPTFVGKDYYCEIGSDNDPVWDGDGSRDREIPCCQSVRDNSGWFNKQLSTPTTDNIEVRLCGDELLSNENIGSEHFELYVQ